MTGVPLASLKIDIKTVIKRRTSKMRLITKKKLMERIEAQEKEIKELKQVLNLTPPTEDQLLLERLERGEGLPYYFHNGNNWE